MELYFVLIQVTTARKAVTLLLSYIIFTKPLSGQHCTGLLLISMGIILKMLPEQCQQKIIAIHSYSPLITEASTSRSDPAEGISRLEEGHEEIKRHLSDWLRANWVSNIDSSGEYLQSWWWLRHQIKSTSVDVHFMVNLPIGILNYICRVMMSPDGVLTRGLAGVH